MRKLILLTVASVILSGCYSSKQLMVDPNTGIPQNCEHFGFGVVGTPLAAAAQAECEAKMRNAGLITMEEFKKKGGQAYFATKP